VLIWIVAIGTGIIVSIASYKLLWWLEPYLRILGRSVAKEVDSVLPSVTNIVSDMRRLISGLFTSVLGRGFRLITVLISFFVYAGSQTVNAVRYL